MLNSILGVTEGVTAVIGSGGKTTLIHVLCGELICSGRVIVCTSTHIRPSETLKNLFSPTLAEIESALGLHKAICIGTLDSNGKFCAPKLPFETLADYADYVLCEADGSRRLPLKVHLPHEPVIPPSAVRTIAVVGVSGVGRAVGEVAHRAELYASVSEIEMDGIVTPSAVAKVLNCEALHDILFINQADTPDLQRVAEAVAAKINTPCVIGSLQKGVWYACCD